MTCLKLVENFILHMCLTMTPDISLASAFKIQSLNDTGEYPTIPPNPSGRQHPLKMMPKRSWFYIFKKRRHSGSATSGNGYTVHSVSIAIAIDARAVSMGVKISTLDPGARMVTIRA
jgi:hypothetical protein